MWLAGTSRSARSASNPIGNPTVEPTEDPVNNASSQGEAAVSEQRHERKPAQGSTLACALILPPCTVLRASRGDRGDLNRRRTGRRSRWGGRARTDHLGRV